MFDIGFAELLIIGVVALLVIGPERLPGAIRTGSAWLNRFRRGFNDIKQEVQQELHNDAVMRELRESRDTLQRESEALRQDLNLSLDTLNPGPEARAIAKEQNPKAEDETTPQSTDSPQDTPDKPA